MEKIINTCYSFAAAIVIFGAWAKLEHKEYGGIALTAGLLTETAIFIIYGFMEWRERSEQTEQPQSSITPIQSQPQPSRNDEELTTTLQQTNRILNKVFRVD